ncbi:MAG: Y-family DNA polymerase [Alistipes senegalensis]|nr:Y-family DNA polymerase [Bacteroides cellulosilyticus]MCM1351312.1 Y-family DNA polymerase [Alistipes senegalensis]
MYGLCDCNNFYASCERVFRPDLVGKPVVVLSNNDGCVIARSNEAKALGIGMGQPLYQVQPLIARHKVEIFSANFALYGDMSRRVMTTLRDSVPRIEIYSIDEAFFDLQGIEEPLDVFGRTVGHTIRRNTGIPVSIGIAPTKTLAKIASKLAKRYPKLDGCCYMHRPQDIEKVLAKFPLQDVWGIGRQYGKLFDGLGIQTARQFVQLPETWIRRRMGVTGLRTWRELQGVACIAFEQLQPPKQRITVSRSFPKEVYLLDDLDRIVSEFASMCAEKLRKQHSVCREVQVFIFTNRFRDDRPQHYETGIEMIAEPTESTLEIVKVARAVLHRIFRPGYGYKRAGVMLSEIRSASQIQGTLFPPVGHARQQRLMKAFDIVNQEHGKGKLIVAAQGTRPFRMNREHLSPRYTTDWKELLVVKAR